LSDWDKHLNRGPGRLKKADFPMGAGPEDWDAVGTSGQIARENGASKATSDEKEKAGDVFDSDGTQIMPHLRRIHKTGHVKCASPGDDLVDMVEAQAAADMSGLPPMPTQGLSPVIAKLLFVDRTKRKLEEMQQSLLEDALMRTLLKQADHVVPREKIAASALLKETGRMAVGAIPGGVIGGALGRVIGSRLGNADLGTILGGGLGFGTGTYLAVRPKTRGDKKKTAQGEFEYADTGPNAGEGSPRVSWQMPGKLKRAAGLDQEKGLDEPEEGTDPPAAFPQPKGRLEALAASQGPLKKVSQASYRALLDELWKLGAAEGVLPRKSKLTGRAKRRELFRFLEKASPAVGAGIGALVGLGSGMRGAKLTEKVLSGVGTGTLIGAIPEMTSDAAAAWRRYRAKVEK
jgi:hypothetical protein